MPTSSSPAYLALLEAARRDDDAAPLALESLMIALYPVVRGFLSRRLASWRDPHDIVDDVVQETIVRCFLHYRGCRAECDRAVVAWALATARNTLVDLLRAPSTKMMAQQFARDFVEDIEATSGRAVAGSRYGEEGFACSLDESAGRRALQEHTRELLLQLAVEAYNDASQETGELLWWRLVMGAEWSEVAAHLQTTAAGAKRRFQRAQSTLERALRRRIAALPDGARAAVDALVARYLASDEEADATATETHTTCGAAHDRHCSPAQNRRSPAIRRTA